jgi:hypothetical protein
LKKLVLFPLFLAALISLMSCQHSQPTVINLTTPYSAVVLDNNQVYYGKLANAGSDYPELTDVYFIHSQVDPNTKAVSNILVPLAVGSEMFAPDRIVLNARHIVMIEPVSQNSKMAQLIQDDKNKHH